MCCDPLREPIPCPLLQSQLPASLLTCTQAQAYNEATFREPDEDGWQPQHEPIDTHPGCTPDTCLHTRLPLPHILGDLSSPSQLSLQHAMLQ